jgi:hypothetical protein
VKNLGTRPWRADAPASITAAVPSDSPERRPRGLNRTTAAVLLLAALGAGTLAGAAVAPGDPPPRARIVVMLAAAPAAAPAPATASATPTPAQTDTPTPEPEATATDAPEATATAAATAAATGTPEPADTATPTATPTPTPTATPFPPVKHAVIVALTGQDEAHAFAADSPATYLAHTLPAKGVVLTAYRGVAGGSLDNGLALLAGAAPTAATEADCAAPGSGCPLPKKAATLPGELADSARAWKAYVQGMPANCATAAAPLYVPARNPFTFMPGLDDCATADVPLDALAGDLSDTDLAPALAYVVPDTCHDGREADGCADGGTGLTRADAWLSQWIPSITGSTAFADGGLLIVLFDGGGLPATDPPAAAGAVVVSSFVHHGKLSDTVYDPLALARTLAGIFAVDAPGDAAGDDVPVLGDDVFR